jgi:hypothetical protein
VIYQSYVDIEKGETTNNARVPSTYIVVYYKLASNSERVAEFEELEARWRGLLQA